MGDLVSVVLYDLVCVCAAVYVGQTSLDLVKRFRRHLRQTAGIDLPVRKHLLACPEAAGGTISLRPVAEVTVAFLAGHGDWRSWQYRPVLTSLWEQERLRGIPEGWLLNGQVWADAVMERWEARAARMYRTVPDVDDFPAVGGSVPVSPSEWLWIRKGLKKGYS